MIKIINAILANLMQLFVFALVVLAFILLYVYLIQPNIGTFVAWIFHFSLFNSFNPHNNQTVY